LTVRIEKPASYDEIKEAIKAAADGPLAGMQKTSSRTSQY
jgi:glyceraldehyde 3-phosphate dehydrogenase